MFFPYISRKSTNKSKELVKKLLEQKGTRYIIKETRNKVLLVLKYIIILVVTSRKKVFPTASSNRMHTSPASYYYQYYYWYYYYYYFYYWSAVNKNNLSLSSLKFSYSLKSFGIIGTFNRRVVLE